MVSNGEKELLTNTEELVSGLNRYGFGCPTPNN